MLDPEPFTRSHGCARDRASHERGVRPCPSSTGVRGRATSPRHVQPGAVPSTSPAGNYTVSFDPINKSRD